MNILADIPAIAGIEDPSQARMVLYQAGRPVHAPMDKVGLAINADVQAGLTAQTRNRLINPAMQITQENARNTALAAGSNIYHSDQWLQTSSIDGTCTFSNTANIYLGSDAGPYCATFVVGTADTSIAAGQYFIASAQTLEGIRIADFNWGTANALPVVARFKAASTIAATFAFYITNGSRSYVRNCTIAANTPTWFTFVVPGDVAGTWAIDTGIGLKFGIALVAGSNFQTTEATWSAGNLFGTSATTNFWATSGSRFSVGAFGLYLDPLATGIAPPWQMPDEAEELAACKRYYSQVKINARLYATVGSNTAYEEYTLVFATAMRITPALTVSVGTRANVGVILGNADNPQSARISLTAAAVGDCYAVGDVNIYSARM